MLNLKRKRGDDPDETEPPKKRQKMAEAEELSCQICLDKRWDTSLPDCPHRMCSSCARKVYDANRICPVCRKPFSFYLVSDASGYRRFPPEAENGVMSDKEVASVIACAKLLVIWETHFKYLKKILGGKTMTTKQVVRVLGTCGTYENKKYDLLLSIKIKPYDALLLAKAFTSEGYRLAVLIRDT